MNASTNMVIYLMGYVITIIYFVVLGCYILAQNGSPLSTRGELAAKRRMTRTAGVGMFVVAFEWLAYLPPILCNWQTDYYIYKVYFISMLALNTPVVYSVMFAVFQRKVDLKRWICALGLPFLLLAVWQLIAPPNTMILVYTGAALSLASYLFLLIKFANEYRIYVRRIQSEYSETSGREIAWSWICFSAFTVQGILFVVYQLFWSPKLEIIYHIFTIVNFGYLCFCICRQVTIDLDVVDDGLQCEDKDESTNNAEREGSQEDNILYSNIEEKLKTLCEERLLFLDPELTRETLALRLAINRTYLGMYFHRKNQTFYQYINTLRVEYACRLIQDSPHLSIRKVAEQSGFRSQTTFRKVFLEVMGCLPSEVRTHLQSLNHTPNPSCETEKA